MLQQGTGSPFPCPSSGPRCRYPGQTDCRTEVICHPPPQGGSTCVPSDLRLVEGQERGFTPSWGALASRVDYSPCVLISCINTSSLLASYSILGSSEMLQAELPTACMSKTFPTLGSASSLPPLLPQLLSSCRALSPGLVT